MRSTTRWISVALTVVLLSGAIIFRPATVLAAPPEPAEIAEARARYKLGLKLYDEEAYAAALAEFERVYQVAPTYKVLYNIGLVRRQVADFAAALRALEQYLAEGRDEIPQTRRDEVMKIIGEIKNYVARIDIKTNVAGADLFVDDVLVGKSPLAEPLLVNPGRRRIEARKKGLLPATEFAALATGDARTISLVLQPPPETLVVRRESADLTPYIGWGVTGALVVAGTITGILALKASSDLKDAESSPNTTRSDLDSDHKQMRTFSVTTDILLGTAIVAAGVSLWFTLKRSPKEGSSAPHTARLRVGVTPTGAMLGGSF